MKNWIKRGTAMSVADVFSQNTGFSVTDIERWGKEPYNIVGFDRAKKMISDAVRTNTTVTVVADYDVDGIMAGFIVGRMLHVLGAKYKVRIPKRFTEGYGLNDAIIDEIDSGLLITVDNGIAAYDAIEKAKAKGLKVIVTDHHLPTGKIPNADVVIDPNAVNCSKFTGYCGAGIAYKLACSIIDDNEEQSLFRICAAFATIADVMPLIEENRYIVKKGLEDAVTSSYVLPKAFYTLLYKLFCLEHISEEDVSFKIAPCINACGRLYDDGGIKVLRALTCNSESVVQEILDANEKRKELTEGMLLAADRIIKDQHMENDYPLVIHIPDAPLGIVGLVASSVSEKWQRPAFVVGNADGGVLKGSGRTYGSKNIKEMLDLSAGKLLGYGGHASAAGISLRREDLDDFRALMKENYGEIEAFDENVYYDFEIKESEFKDILDELNKFGPYGEGNPQPVFKISGYAVHDNMGQSYQILGKKRNVLKFQGINSDAIGFGMLEKYESLGFPRKLDMVGHLSYNYFKGIKRPQVEIIDMQPAQNAV